MGSPFVLRRLGGPFVLRRLGAFRRLGKKLGAIITNSLFGAFYVRRLQTTRISHRKTEKTVLFIN